MNIVAYCLLDDIQSLLLSRPKRKIGFRSRQIQQRRRVSLSRGKYTVQGTTATPNDLDPVLVLVHESWKQRPRRLKVVPVCILFDPVALPRGRRGT